jgi:hypothetical protein
MRYQLVSVGDVLGCVRNFGKRGGWGIDESTLPLRGLCASEIDFGRCATARRPVVPADWDDYTSV